MWFSLRTRIRLGYGLVLLIAVALAAVAFWRLHVVHEQLRRMDAEVNGSVTFGANLLTRIADVQQAFDLYLQLPDPSTFAVADQSLTILEAEIAAREQLLGANQSSEFHALKAAFDSYHATFHDLSELVTRRQSLTDDLTGVLANLSNALNVLINERIQNSDVDLQVLNQLLEAQSSFQLVVTQINNRTFVQESQAQIRVQGEYEKIQAILLRTQNRPSDAPALVPIRTDIRRASELTIALVEMHGQIRRQRDTLLQSQEAQLRTQTDRTVQQALQSLAEAAEALQREALLLQQVITGTLLAALLALVSLSLGLSQHITGPVRALTDAVRRMQQGASAPAIPRAGAEISALVASFADMADAIERQRRELRSQADTLADQNQEMERSLADLQAAEDQRSRIEQLVRALSVPILPVLDGTFVVPLVGEIDPQRTETLRQRVLAEVARSHARIVILDVTGIPIVDPALIGNLVGVAAAVQLLGARCIMVGIGPEVAQALVGAGADLARLHTLPDLQSAVVWARRHL